MTKNSLSDLLNFRIKSLNYLSYLFTKHILFITSKQSESVNSGQLKDYLLYFF